jgi:hypothetical protein
MTWDEVWMRSRQEVLKRWDAGLYWAGFRRGVDGIVPSHLNSSRVLNESQASFFWDPSDLSQLIAIMRKRLPHEVEQTIEEADRICQHRLDLLGFQGLDFGSQMDWHFDVIHGKRAPRKPWFKIHYLDFDEVGDHKIIWELNRHQHLVALAKAWCFTREERYAAELLRQWYHWQQENPYPMGINWASSLEVGFRTLSWLWVRHLLASCPSVTEGFRLDLLRAMALNGQHIERYLSTYFSPNTHLLGEAVALFFAGTLCPELPHARRWQQRGLEIVLQQAERQVQPDGMHFEQSVYYHVYALDFFLHARILAACNRIPIPAAFDQTIQKMLEALAALAQAGPPPRLGDDDGGRVFNPRRNRAQHMLDPLATGAVVFLRGDFKAAAGGLREETIWLMGPERVTQFEQLAVTERPTASMGLASSGFYVMADANPMPQQLVIDAGPQGTGSAGHGHADALGLCLSADGREWLADSGTFSYLSSDAARDFFRGTAAHNTLQIDGLSQAGPNGPFAWHSLPQVQVDRWVNGETFDFFTGSHTGYCRLNDPVLHRRWVFHLKSGFWFVRDLAEGVKVHQLDLLWHFAPGLMPRKDAASNSIFFARDEAAGRETLALIPLEGHRWDEEISQGSVSPVYGRQEPAAVLRFSTRTGLPAEFAIVLLSVDMGVPTVARGQEPVLSEVKDGRATSSRSGEEPGVLTEILQEGSGARGYCYRGPRGSHCLFFAEGPEKIGHPREPALNAVKGVPLRPSTSWNLGPWESDAEFLYFGTAPDGGQHCVVCNGSYVHTRGQPIVALKSRATHFEWMTDGAGRQILCPDESAVGHMPNQAMVTKGVLS